MVVAIMRGRWGVIIERRQQNEEVTVWNNPFSVVRDCHYEERKRSCEIEKPDQSRTSHRRPRFNTGRQGFKLRGKALPPSPYDLISCSGYRFRSCIDPGAPPEHLESEDA